MTIVYCRHEWFGRAAERSGAVWSTSVLSSVEENSHYGWRCIQVRSSTCLTYKLLICIYYSCTERTGLPPLMDQIIRRRNSLFGHVARLGNDTPAYQALRCQIDISLGRLPNRTWKRPPGRPRSKWLCQIRSDNNFLAADLWRSAVRRGHSGVTRRSQLATR